MSVKAAVVLGLFLLLAALVHGGVYAPGNDFVVNRFTGRFEFVPSQDEAWEDDEGMSGAHGRALTSQNAPDRVNGLYHRR